MEIVFFWIVMALICAMVAGSRKGGGVGLLFFFYGLVIWPIALVHALLLSGHEAPPEDAAEAEQAKGGRRMPCRVAVDITYKGENGEKTERYVEGYTLVEKPAPINIRRIHGEGVKRLYLQGFCNLKQGMRTFRVDRIKQLVDAETGEVADDPAAWLRARALAPEKKAS